MVNPDDLLKPEPVAVYALEQTIPPSWPYPAISVNYEAIIAAQGNADDTYRTLSIGLLTLSPVFFVIGYLLVLHNRRHRVAPKPD